MLHFDTQAMPAAGQKLGPMPKDTETTSGETEETSFADLIVAEESSDVAESDEMAVELDVQVNATETVDAPVLTETEAEVEEEELPVSDRAEAELLQTMAFAQAPTSRMADDSRHAVIAGLAQNGRVAINNGSLQTGRLPVQNDTPSNAIFPTDTQQINSPEISPTRVPLAPATAIQAAFASLTQNLGKAREEVRAETLISPRSTESAAPTSTPVLPKTPLTPNLNGPAPLAVFEKQALAPDLFGMSSLEPETIAAQQSSTQQTQQSIVAPTPLRVNAQPVAAQIAVALFQSKGATTEISLNPQELGKVRISMTSGDAGLVVNILAERPETTDLMRRHIDTLAREFQDLGYQQMSFSFSEGDRQSDQESTERNAPSNILIAPEADQPVQRAVALGTLDLKL